MFDVETKRYSSNTTSKGVTRVKLHELLAERAKADIQVGGASVQFEYWVLWRERFSDEEWEHLLSLRGRDYLKAMLPKVLLSWDIVDDSGAPIPITAEAFDQFHIPDRLLASFDQRVFNSDLAGKALAPTSSN
jgi:hypothetical protein